jgi:hypothetical protein
MMATLALPRPLQPDEKAAAANAMRGAARRLHARDTLPLVLAALFDEVLS